MISRPEHAEDARVPLPPVASHRSERKGVAPRAVRLAPRDRSLERALATAVPGGVRFRFRAIRLGVWIVGRRLHVSVDADGFGFRNPRGFAQRDFVRCRRATVRRRGVSARRARSRERPYASS